MIRERDRTGNHDYIKASPSSTMQTFD